MQPPPLKRDLKANLIKMLSSILLTAKQEFMYSWSVQPVMILITLTRSVMNKIYGRFMRNKTFFETSLIYNDYNHVVHKSRQCKICLKLWMDLILTDYKEKQVFDSIYPKVLF